VKSKLEVQGMDVLGQGPEQLDKFNRAQVDRWGRIVKQNKISAGS
jgi:hypothetical protein